MTTMTWEEAQALGLGDVLDEVVATQQPVYLSHEQEIVAVVLPIALYYQMYGHAEIEGTPINGDVEAAQ